MVLATESSLIPKNVMVVLAIQSYSLQFRSFFPLLSELILLNTANLNWTRYSLVC